MSNNRANRFKRGFSTTCNHVNYKVIMLGDYGVGKSTLFKWLRDGEPPVCDGSITSFRGADRCVKKFTLNEGHTVQMEIWDTAGTERFRTVTKNYYHMASAVVLVYDASELCSLNALTEWMEEARTYAANNVTFMLLANKYDLSTDSVALGEAFASAHDIALHYRVSAKDGDKDSLIDVFHELAEYLHCQQQKREKSDEVSFEQLTITDKIDQRLLNDTCYGTKTKSSSCRNCPGCARR